MIAQLNLIKEDKKKLKEFVSDNECEEYKIIHRSLRQYENNTRSGCRHKSSQ